MGGQACVLYGAAEFSRDLDLVLLADPANLERMDGAFRDLEAHVIAVPPLDLRLLEEGLAVHYRCHHPEVEGLRIDLMSQLRGVAPFQDLWNRRTTFEFEEELLEVLSLEDLVLAKKTQRDKDWPMIRRLVDVNYLAHRERPTRARLDFWCRELRSPELLIELGASHPERVEENYGMRPLLRLATSKDLENGALARAIRDEEQNERDRDAEYWRPLKKKLEALRHSR